MTTPAHSESLALHLMAASVVIDVVCALADTKE